MAKSKKKQRQIAARDRKEGRQLLMITLGVVAVALILLYFVFRSNF